MIGCGAGAVPADRPRPPARVAALTAIQRDGEAAHLAPLRAAIDDETDPALKAQMQRLERLLTIRFDPDEAARIARDRKLPRRSRRRCPRRAEPAAGDPPAWPLPTDAAPEG